jgi:hypothetical protein
VKTSIFTLAGAAVLLGGAALASETSQIHKMTVQLPDGGVARVEYTGNVKPHVTFTDRLPASFENSQWIWQHDPALAELDRISAQMDQYWADFDRQMASLITPTFSALKSPDRPIEAAIRNVPVGSSSYSFISTTSLNGACVQSIEVTQHAGAKPRVVRQSSGDDCGKPGQARTNDAQSSSTNLINAGARGPAHLEPAVFR